MAWHGAASQFSGCRSQVSGLTSSSTTKATFWSESDSAYNDIRSRRIYYQFSNFPYPLKLISSFFDFEIIKQNEINKKNSRKFNYDKKNEFLFFLSSRIVGDEKYKNNI